jgi:nitrile hydratase beta subunit
MMDGTHDLGGRQGFGPIAVKDGDAPFHYDWEWRMWALARAGIAQDITIDWFRHGLERMVPKDYLSLRYFEKWCANYIMLLIDNGAASFAEVEAGHVEYPGEHAAAKTLSDVLQANRGGHISFETEIETKPRFAVGDTITTKRVMPTNHTRLPGYARDATGTIIAYHGAHFLPDKGVHGVHEGEHLYTVSFKAQDLWGAQANPRDTVTLELWECYFVSP